MSPFDLAAVPGTPMLYGLGFINRGGAPRGSAICSFSAASQSVNLLRARMEGRRSPSGWQ